INESSAENTEDNSNDEDNEDSYSAKEDKILKILTLRGHPRKNNDESRKQTIGSKRKGREYKVEDDDDNDGTKRIKKKMDHKEAKVKRKRNQKNTKRKIMDESSFKFKVTTTTSKDNLDTETNVLSLTDNYILVTSQSVHDILGIPMGGCSLESLASRSPDDHFIKEWFSQFGDKKEVRPNDITDVILSIKDAEKCYNIHRDLISVREKLDEGPLRFPDYKKLNMFREKFEETTTGIDIDDTTGIDKESDSPDCQMESDLPTSDDDNQKSNFQVLFHKESGNSDLQRMKNKERNEDVHYILNEDDKVDDSCPATGVCSVIEGDEVKLNSVTEGKGVKFIKNDNVLVDDVPNEMIKFSFEAIIQDSVERSEHTLEKEKKKFVNEELRSQSLKGNVGAKVALDSQHTIEDIFKQDEQIQSAEDVGCSISDFDDAKLDVYNGPDLRSPYEYLPVDVKKPVSDVEKIV
nr:hypothetical protein [Tanacetum cinerariifolium]